MLSMDSLPAYRFSSFRYFDPGERHIHRTFREDVLLLVMDGVLRFEEGGNAVEVGSGEYYIQRHGLEQSGVTASSTPKYFYIHFIGGFTPTAHMLPIRGRADMAALFPLMQQLETLRVSGAPTVQKNAVFYQILSELYNAANSSPMRELTMKVLAIVSRDMRCALTLDDLAAACGYSRNHIIHAFKRDTGMTPYAYILRLRLEAAKDLLRNSQLPVEQIAAACGFGSYINLYKEFKKHEHCSPAKWRSINS